MNNATATATEIADKIVPEAGDEVYLSHARRVEAMEFAVTLIADAINLAVKAERANLEKQVFDLKCAIYDVISMERTIVPYELKRRRRYAYMRNGQVLATVIDRAWDLLGYDWRPSDPAHGGKIPLDQSKDEGET